MPVGRVGGACAVQLPPGDIEFCPRRKDVRCFGLQESCGRRREAVGARSGPAFLTRDRPAKAGLSRRLPESGRACVGLRREAVVAARGRAPAGPARGRALVGGAACEQGWKTLTRGGHWPPSTRRPSASSPRPRRAGCRAAGRRQLQPGSASRPACHGLRRPAERTRPALTTTRTRRRSDATAPSTRSCRPPSRSRHGPVGSGPATA